MVCRRRLLHKALRIGLRGKGVKEREREVNGEKDYTGKKDRGEAPVAVILVPCTGEVLVTGREDEEVSENGLLKP